MLVRQPTPASLKPLGNPHLHLNRHIIAEQDSSHPLCAASAHTKTSSSSVVCHMMLKRDKKSEKARSSYQEMTRLHGQGHE
jgi:hypothetical protein